MSKKGQKKHVSLIEAILNVASGMIIAFTVTQVLSPSLGFDISPIQNMTLTCILTVVSILRTYIWRRIFNKHHIKYGGCRCQRKKKKCR